MYKIEVNKKTFNKLLKHLIKIQKRDYGFDVYKAFIKLHHCTSIYDDILNYAEELYFCDYENDEQFVLQVFQWYGIDVVLDTKLEYTDYSERTMDFIKYIKTYINIDILECLFGEQYSMPYTRLAGFLISNNYNKYKDVVFRIDN